MDYTQSDANVTDLSTGHRMHQSTAPITTEVSPEDMNGLIWEVLELIKAADIVPAAFNKTVPGTYTQVHDAVAVLILRKAVEIVGAFAAPSGASLSGFKPSGVNSVPTDSQTKLRESVSLCDYGGVDDWNGTTGTDSFSAWSRIYADYPGGVTIKLPKLGTGVYLNTGAQYTASGSGFVLDPDEGVSIYNAGGAIPCTSAGVKTKRRITIRAVSNETTAYLSPEEYKNVGDKSGFMSAEDGECPSLATVLHTTAENSNISWPDGPATPETPILVTSDTTTWGPNYTNFNLTTVPLRPGSEVCGYFSDNAAGGFAYAGILFAGVITDNGFAIVRQDVGGGALLMSVKSGSAAITNISLSPPTIAQLSYRFAKGLVAVRVHTPTSFSVLVNGVEVARVPNSGGVILQAGFGPGFSQNANNSIIAGMSISHNVKTMGVQPLKIVVVGDSITDPAMGCSWSDFLRQYLSGVGGVQMLDIMNIAVAGATSTGQAGYLSTIAIAGYQYCLIQIGVNDIQGGAAVSTLINNIAFMVDYCVANGVIPIVGIPTMWYGIEDSAGTGNVGGTTQHKEQGSPYRATLLRYLASAGVAVNLMTLSDFGAIIPALITAPNVDSVVLDNLHPTIYGRMVIGYSWAKTLIGNLIPRVDKTVQARTIPASWAGLTYGMSALPTYSVTADLCLLAGYISSAADPADGEGVLTLPGALFPSGPGTFVVPVATSSGTPSGTCTLQITGAGLVKVYAAPAGTRYIYLGINFQIAS